MKQLVLLSFFLLSGLGIFAQSVHFDMPGHAGVKLNMTLKNGVKADTIYIGSFDDKGQLTVPIPKDYRGIASIRPDRIGAYYEFIASGEEDMTLYCEGEYAYTGTVEFKDSPENDFLENEFQTQAIRRQKIGLLSELEQLYLVGAENLPPATMTNTITSEIESLKSEQFVFESMLSESNLFAARFIELHNFLNKEVAGLMYADSVQMEKVRNYVINDLDIQSLYTSGMWFPVLNGLLVLYSEEKLNHDDFIRDMTQVLNRADDKVYLALAENLFEICEAMAWNNLEEELAYFLINDRRIQEPTGKLKLLMSIFKLGKGSQAPALVCMDDDKVGRFSAATNTILVFHETGCGNCDREIEELKKNYAALKEKGYEVFTISADLDKEVFENSSKDFPWQHKYCNGEDFDSEDFRNYGVIGTPTFYVIDKDGIVQGRYARLTDTGIL